MTLLCYCRFNNNNNCYYYYYYYLWYDYDKANYYNCYYTVEVVCYN